MKASPAVPFHVRGSRVCVKNFRGSRLLFEEVYHPCDLKDSDFVDKKGLFEQLWAIGRKTVREDYDEVVNKYFNKATIMHLVSTPELKVVGVSMSEAAFDSDNLTIYQWLNMYLDEYREKGIGKECVLRAFYHTMSEYRKIKGYTGLMYLLPYFKKCYVLFRTFNPIIYSGIMNAPITCSPKLDGNGMIMASSISDEERKIRKNFLRRFGYREDEIDDDSIFIVKAFSNEAENRKLHANIPEVADAKVNKFFKNHLGLDKGNMLVGLVHCRPAPSMAAYYLFINPMRAFVRALTRSLHAFRHYSTRVQTIPNN